MIHRRSGHAHAPREIGVAAGLLDTFAVRADTLPAMANPLVIVESPAKAKTIAGFLGDRDYVVESSVGHIRDLPRNAADVPAAYKGEPWARLGVDVDNDFKPLYVVTRSKKDVVAKLEEAVKDGQRALPRDR